MVKISAARQKVIEFYSNPAKFLKMETLCHNYDNCYTIEGMPFSEFSGMKKLGSGNYSDVYELDETRVLKIVKSQDTGYERFATICRANRNNPFLPKILFSATWAGKRIYVLEKLSPVLPEGFAPPGFNEHGWQSKEDTAKDQLRSALQYTGADANPYVGIVNPDLALVATLLKGGLNDLHNGNIMFRGTVPVVTDPMAD